LARRIVATSGDQGAFPMEAGNFIRMIDRASKADVPPTPAGRAQWDAVQAIKTSLEAAQPRFADARSRALARTYSEADLRRIADFLESPAGRAWVGRAATVESLETADTMAILRAAAEAGRAAACGEGGCPGQGSPARTP
jgi:hypothetical protein